MEYIQAEQKKERNSGVELYKIIAMIMICSSHCTQTAVGFVTLSDSFIDCILNIIYTYFGQAGNVIFIVCSSYFLIDSKGVKGNKVIKMLLDSTFISIIIHICFVCAGYSFDAKESIRHFFPDFYVTMWFIPVYVLFYMIHPFLNAAIKNITRRTHLTFCVIVFVVYGLLGILFDWQFEINNLVKFAIVYIIVAYMKLYCADFCKDKRKNLIVFIVFLSLFLILFVVRTYFKCEKLILNHYYSPILLPVFLSLFNLFNGMKFKSKAINFFASCSLFFYCIHESSHVRGLLRVNFYNYLFGISSSAYVGWIFLCTAIWIIGSFLLSAIYKLTLSHLSGFIADKLNRLFNKAIDFLMRKTEKNSGGDLTETTATANQNKPE